MTSISGDGFRAEIGDQIPGTSRYNLWLLFDTPDSQVQVSSAVDVQTWAYLHAKAANGASMHPLLSAALDSRAEVSCDPGRLSDVLVDTAARNPRLFPDLLRVAAEADEWADHAMLEDMAGVVDACETVVWTIAGVQRRLRLCRLGDGRVTGWVYGTGGPGCGDRRFTQSIFDPHACEVYADLRDGLDVLDTMEGGAVVVKKVLDDPVTMCWLREAVGSQVVDRFLFAQHLTR